MKKIEKKVITHVAYANIRDLKVVVDANGNNVNTFSYDEIVFSEDKETVLEFNTKTIENVNDEYKNKFTKIVASDLNGLLSKEAKIKEFKEKQSKIKKIESKNKVKNLVVAKDQPKKSHLIRNTLVVGAVIVVGTLLFKPASNLITNLTQQSNSNPGTEEQQETQEQQEISTLEQLNVAFDEVIENATAKFKASNIVVDEMKLNTYVYLLNYDTIRAIDVDNTIADRLKSSNLLTESASENVEMFENVMGSIINHNGNVSVANENKELSMFEDKLINQSDMIINKNYKSYVDNLENTIYNIRHTTDKTIRQTKMEEANSLITGVKFYDGINFEYLPSSIKLITSSELIGRFVGFTGEFGKTEYLSLKDVITAERNEADQILTGNLIENGVCAPEKSK